MSAFTLTHKHINALVHAAFFKKASYCDRDTFYIWHRGKTHMFNRTNKKTLNPDVLGQILVNQNFKSVNFRYKDKSPSFKFKYELSHDQFTNVQLLKACDCYDYQSCETPNYEQSLVAKIIDKIRSQLICSLNGYADSEWTIEEDLPQAVNE